VVPKTALVPFGPDDEPYTTYAKTVRRFFGDAAIQRATAYWNSGEIPPSFKWLSFLQNGRINSSKDVLQAQRKRSLTGEVKGTPITASAVPDDEEDDEEGGEIDPGTPRANGLAMKSLIGKPTVQPPKKKPAAQLKQAAGKPGPKTIGRPAKKALLVEVMSPTLKPLAIRRASVDTESFQGLATSRNDPPRPPFKPADERFSLLPHFLPNCPLSTLI